MHASRMKLPVNKRMHVQLHGLHIVYFHEQLTAQLHWLLTSWGRCLLMYPLSNASSRNGFFRTGLSWKKDPILAPENGRYPAGCPSSSSTVLLVPGSATLANLMWLSGGGTPRSTLERPPATRQVSRAEHTDMAPDLQDPGQRWLLTPRGSTPGATVWRLERKKYFSFRIILNSKT